MILFLPTCGFEETNEDEISVSVIKPELEQAIAMWWLLGNQCMALKAMIGMNCLRGY